MVPKMNDYLSLYDRSEFCNALPELLPNFVLHKENHKAMVVYQEDHFAHDDFAQVSLEFMQSKDCLEHVC